MNGSLLIQNMGWADRGQYRCLAWNNIQQVLNYLNVHQPDRHSRDTQSPPTQRPSAQIYEERLITLKMDTEYRQKLYTMSLIYGFATAGVFLLLTLLGKLIFFWLHK